MDTFVVSVCPLGTHIALILVTFVLCIPLSCTSSPCNLLFLNPGVYGLVPASRRRDRIDLGFLRSLHKRGGGGQPRWAVCATGVGAHQGQTSLWTEALGQQIQSNDPANHQHILNTPINGHR